MAKNSRENEAFIKAMELAESGRFKNISEVDEALMSLGETLPTDMPKAIRGMIDATCLRARRARHWQT
jgi:hypothetical protein